MYFEDTKAALQWAVGRVRVDGPIKFGPETHVEASHGSVVLFGHKKNVKRVKNPLDMGLDSEGLDKLIPVASMYSKMSTSEHANVD